MGRLPEPTRHIGLNAVFLQPQMGGLETYVGQLLPALIALRPDWRFNVFVNEHGRDLLADQPWAGSVELVTSPLLGKRYVRALSELTYLGWLARRRRVDLLHSLALIAPLWPGVPSVVTIADVTWMHHIDPEDRMTIRLWRAVVPTVAKRADRIIAISENGKREIAADLQVPAAKIDVALLGCSVDRSVTPSPEAELRSRLNLGEGPIVLAVSATKAHKNVGGLISAMQAILERVPDARLVVPGNPTEYQRELVKLADSVGVGEAVVFPGWVSSEDLEGLYACSSCFTFPSLVEGFGLPVLEAMARGVPVVSSDRSALPEIAGDAAVLVNPESESAIAAGILRVLEEPDLAAKLAELGSARAARFSWRACAEATIATYERVLTAAR